MLALEWKPLQPELQPSDHCKASGAASDNAILIDSQDSQDGSVDGAARDSAAFQSKVEPGAAGTVETEVPVADASDGCEGETSLSDLAAGASVAQSAGRLTSPKRPFVNCNIKYKPLTQVSVTDGTRKIFDNPLQAYENSHGLATQLHSSSWPMHRRVVELS